MTRSIAVVKVLLALVIAVALLGMTGGEAAAQKPILSGPLVKLDIKPAQIDKARGKPQGTLTVAMHFGLDPGWL